MILIGQYDSPFTRRVGIAMTLYDIAFVQWPWSVFGDADKIRKYNPLIRVPALLLENGDVLIESHAIIDYLDDLMPPERRMFPVEGAARSRALNIAALATGISDKVVSLFYEKNLHKEVSQLWIMRCHTQIEAALGVLEKDRAGRTSTYWFGEIIGHADIAVAAMLRHLLEAQPRLIAMKHYPALRDHAQSLEDLPAFKAVSQPFIAPVEGAQA
jgi:glutathione S-transferase